MPDTPEGIAKAALEAWSRWQRQPGAPIDFGKALGVLGAYYLYRHLTPDQPVDERVSAVAGLAALLGVVVPAPDDFVRDRDRFLLTLQRSAAGRVEDRAALAWFSALETSAQGAVANLVTDKTDSDAVAFLRDQKNREGIEWVLQIGRVQMPPTTREQVGSREISIAKSALLVERRLGLQLENLVRLATGEKHAGIRCAVKTPSIEIESSMGRMSIACAQIWTMFFLPGGRRGRDVDVNVETLRGDKLSGRLLTQEIEVSYTEGIEGAGRVDCRKVAHIVSASWGPT